jgi:hypothetical protein
MGGLSVFRKMSIDQAARWLELHPFEVLRLLVNDDALPRDLGLDPSHVERVRVRGGLESWWEGAPDPVPSEPRARTLARALITRMLDRDMVDPNATRADNLFRGLDGDSQVVLRRAVNLLIKEQYLATRMATEGLMVALHPGAVRQLRDFAAGGSRLLDALWERL